jgi:hypothetical protein
VRASVLAGVGEKSGVLARMQVAGPKLVLRRHALMLALLIASFAAADRAQAVCTPTTTPLTNTPVSCTGTTTNQNGTNGFGTLNDSGNTITVVPGASVTGDDPALGSGVVAPGLAKVVNQGTITGPASTGSEASAVTSL